MRKNQKSGCVIAMIVGGVMLFGMLFCAGVIAALAIPAYQAARQAARQPAQRVQSQNNLKQIGADRWLRRHVHALASLLFQHTSSERI